MTVSATIQEYERREIPLGSAAARELRRAAGGKLGVAPGSAEGHYEITATDHVGSFVTTEATVLVRPKVPLHNVFTLLDAGLPADAWRSETFLYGADRDLLPAFAAVFARSVEGAISQGLLHAYREHQEDLISLRGRMDLARVVRRSGVAYPMPSRFDEFTVDIPENRILRAAVRRLRRIPGVPVPAAQALARVLARLEGVDDVHVEGGDVDRAVVYTRLNEHYRPALRLADLVLGGASLLDRPGGLVADSFTLSMNHLFERWTTHRFHRHLARPWRLRPQERWSLDRDRRVSMYPDLVFYEGDRPRYVADVKYKLTATGLGRSDDYYQLLAYTAALGLEEGLLIYCQADGEAPPREIHVDSVGKRLLTYSLPLSGSTRDVESAMTELVRFVEDRMRSRVSVGAVW